jgi:hypothetical protein
MNILNKWWKRLLIGLLLGGMMSEVIRLLTHQKVKINAIFLAIIFYFVLTNAYRRNQSNLENTTKENKK